VKRAPYSFAQHWDVWEAAAARAVLADKYCSSPFWGVSLAGAFHGRGEMFVYQEGADLAIFQELDVEGGRLVMPCDMMWCLGSPILAQDASDFLARLCNYWNEVGGGVRQVTVGGLFEDNPIWSSPVWMAYPHWNLTGAGRQVASLEGGLDGFMSRRSVNFRSRLRRAVKKARREGICAEYWPHSADQITTLGLLDRAMKIEARSWKGLAGQGVDRGQMNSFYRRMLPLLAGQGRLRGLFLKRDGQDLSYLFGAAFAGYFRGLQFSHLETEAESLGNVGQWKMLQHLVEEGCQSYDLGQAMAYKTRWAETNIPSRSMAFLMGEQGS
jgi:hypothetical protein